MECSVGRGWKRPGGVGAAVCRARERGERRARGSGEKTIEGSGSRARACVGLGGPEREKREVQGGGCKKPGLGKKKGQRSARASPGIGLGPDVALMGCSQSKYVAFISFCEMI